MEFVSPALPLQRLFKSSTQALCRGTPSPPSFLLFTLWEGQRNLLRGHPSLGKELTLRTAVSQGENGSPVSCQGCPAEGWG